jgi:hypothetical protein
MPEDVTPVAGIELPEDLTALSDKEVDNLLKQVAKKFAPFNDESKPVKAEDLATVNALVEQAELLQGEKTTRANAAAEAQAQVDAARQRMSAVNTEPEETPAEGEQAPAEEAPAEETTTEVPAEEPPAEETPAQPEAMAASTGKPKSAVKGGISVKPRAVAVDKTKVQEGNGGITVVASSDIPGVPSSSRLDKDGLSVAMHAKARNLSDGRGRREKHLIASISVDNPQNDVSNLTSDNDIRIAWDKAHKVDSMVASGGWCAPSETIYDFACDYEAMPEAIDLPTITSTRGGLRYPISPLLSDVFDDENSGFTWTEADDIAAAEEGGPTKACYTIPCPEFDEVRLQAQGICVTAGNLTDRAYPELTNRYIDLVMTAHAHRMNGLKIANLVTASTAVSPTVTDLSASEAVLAGLELQIAVLRDQFFMGADQVLEVVLPRWVRTVIRRDLARRAGVEFNQVTNAEIAAFFTEIGARAQFVSDWQRITGNVGSVVTLPETVDVLVYPAGAHTLLDGGSLDLGVVRDSTLNATNDYTAAWTEEFWQTLTRCVSLVVTIALCPNGWTGAPNEIACPTA